MSRSKLHDWECAIKKLSGDNADKMLDVARDIYNTAFVRGKNYISLEQEPILDKIKADILEEKEYAYADFERYKVEYLGQDWEDALDSLPQDDFRYGMERCIEIIDKYKAESEEEG